MAGNTSSNENTRAAPVPESWKPSLEAFLTEQTGEPVSIRAIDKPSGTGFSAATILLTISAPTLPDRLVVQAAPPRETALFEQYDLAQTFATQQVLARHGVPVPNVRWLCEDAARLGTPFYVMDFVEGRVPPDRPPYHSAGWLFEADLPTRAATWNAGIGAMAQLHGVAADVLDFHQAQAAEDAAKTRVAEWRAFHETLGDHGDPLIEHALVQLGRSAPTMTDMRVHWGDAKLGNMIFAQNRVAAILDWELSGVGAPEEDLAHWFAVDWFLSTGTGTPRLPGLPGVNASVEHYAKTRTCAASTLDWWFAFSLVRMAVIFQRARSVVVKRQTKGLAKERTKGPIRPNALSAHLEQIVDGTAWETYAQ